MIPGVNDVTVRALLAAPAGQKALEALAKKAGLAFGWDAKKSEAENAEALLEAGYAKNVDLFTIDELQAEALELSNEIWRDHPTPPLPPQGHRRRRRQGPARGGEARAGGGRRPRGAAPSRR